MQKIKTFIKTRKLISIIGLLIFIILGYFVFGSKSNEVNTLTIKRGDFIKEVSISGKVIPAQSVDLAFETSGTVARIYKDVGQKVNKGEVIVALDASDIVAKRDIALAELLGAEAELLKIKNTNTGSDISSNKDQVVNAIIDAYTMSDDAVRNKVDQFFDKPRTSPEIRYTFYDYFSTKDKINSSRAQIENDLEKFGLMVSGLSSGNYTDQKLRDAKIYVQKVKSFLDTVSFAVNSFEESYTLSESTIDGYRSDVAQARTNINDALSELLTYENKLQGSVSDAGIQEAKVKSKEANVRSFDAQIAKTVIVAPFSGIVSLQDAKVGESVSQNTVIAAMISDGYQIEAYIPEVNISGIKLGNQAVVTLDAYGDEKFFATIIHIDPAETVRDGVSNYKIKLAFDKVDARILSGMTADVNIITEKNTDVVVVPERSVVVEGELNYVLKTEGGVSTKVQVVLGRKDGKGNIEIINGLQGGEVVLLDPLI